MALQKTNTESKLIETSEIEKVARKPGQIIFTDDGKLFYDNTQTGRLKLTRSALEPQSAAPNSLILPGGLIEKDTSRGYGYTIELETSRTACQWINTGNYAIVTHEFPPHHGTDTVFEISLDTLDSYSKQFFELLMTSDTTTSYISSDTFEHVTPGFFVSVVLDTGETKDLAFYKDPRDASHIYMSTEQGVDPFEASGAEATRMRVSVRIKPLYCDLVWDGLTLSARVGTPQSDGIAFGAQNVYKQSPITGDKSKFITASDWNTYSAYTFIAPGYSKEELVNGSEPTARVFVPDRESESPIDESYSVAIPFRSEWLSDDNTSCFIPVGNRHRVYKVRFDHPTNSSNSVSREFTSDSAVAYRDGMKVSWSDSLDLTFDCETITVFARLYAETGDVIAYHHNSYGIGVYENLSSKQIEDEVTESSDLPVKSSGVAKCVSKLLTSADAAKLYQPKLTIDDKVSGTSVNPVENKAVYEAIQDAVSGVYKPVGSYTVEALNLTPGLDFAAYWFNIGDVVNVVDSGTITLLRVSKKEAHVTGYMPSESFIVTLANPYGGESADTVEGVVVSNDAGISVSLSKSAVSIHYDMDWRSVIDITLTEEQFTDFGFSTSSSGSDPEFLTVELVRSPLEVLAGDNLVLTDAGWDRLSGTIDLSGYQQKLDFAESFTADGASGKIATVGVAKDYIDQQIALNTQGTGAIVNLVGSGQATLLSSYVTSSTTTLTAGEYLWSPTLSSPAYKIILPAIDFPGSYQCTFISDDNSPSISMPLSSSEMVVLEIIKGGTNGVVISNRVANGAMTATHMYTGVNLSAFKSFYITATSAATIPANTSIEVYGWPCVQDSDTATSIMDMLKEIYDTQESFKSRTDVLDTTGLTRTYANYSDLPSTADVGSLATVSADSDAGKRGLYMFMSGIWNKLSFSSETINSGDTVLAALE